MAQLTTATLAQGFQISESNPILGLESRADLLRSLGKSLLAQSNVFGKEGRPGNVVGIFTFNHRRLTSSYKIRRLPNFHDS